MIELVRQEICVGSAPNDQAAIDCVPDWTSQFPSEAGVKAGTAALFEDGRVSWALERLGGVEGQSVLEFGPLEGGHTYMLERAGAAEIIAIEANRRCYVKCLIAKEILGLRRARFLCGDFLPWLEQERRRFDLIFCAGVLYHMAEPIKLLDLVGAATDRVYIYTHYIPDDLRSNEPWASTILGVEERAGISHYIKSYADMGKTTIYCGGVYQSAAWLRKRDILRKLEQLGFKYTACSVDVRDHPNGPCMNMVASRKPLS